VGLRSRRRVSEIPTRVANHRGGPVQSILTIIGFVQPLKRQDLTLACLATRRTWTQASLVGGSPDA
jgi:hypothetical protein